MTRKKIIFSDNTLWGLINFRGKVIKHYVSKGYKVIVIAPQNEVSELQTEIPDYVTYIPVNMDRNKTNPIADIKYFIKIYNIYKKEKPDYVFHYTIKPNIYGSIAARLNHIKSASMMAGLGYAFKNNNLISFVGRTLYKIGLSCTNSLFLLNKDNMNEIIRRKLCDKKKIILLKGGEGLNLNDFPYMNNESDIITFLFIGRVLYEKGYNEFIECAKEIREEHPNVSFEILGTIDPNYPNSVSKEKIEEDESKGYIKYIGFTKDILSILKRKGIVVMLPSYYGEGLNRSLMEACATGKPIITTTNPGCIETVENGINGYLVAPKNKDALVKAAKRYLKLSNGEKNAMSKASRKIAENKFDINNVILEYDKLV